jgi:hypothetical protein
MEGSCGYIKNGPPAWRVGRGANYSSSYKKHLVAKYYTESRTSEVLVNTVMNLRVP